MAFDTFDEGINPGGMRSKNEIKTLICYLYNSVKENIDKGIVIQAILKQGLANYFETSSAFDDLVTNGNLVPADDEPSGLISTRRFWSPIKNPGAIAFTRIPSPYFSAISLASHWVKLATAVLAAEYPGTRVIAL